MKVRVEDSGACRKTVIVEVPAEDMADGYAAALKRVQAVARLPGFRKGMVPTAVVEGQFGRDVEHAAQEALLPVFYREALKQQELVEEELVEIRDVVCNKNTGFAFTAVLDVAPTLKLPKYKKLALETHSVTVADAEVDEFLKRLLERTATYADVTDRPVQTGDLAQVDYAGVSDEQPVADLVPGNRAIGEGRDFWLLLGEMDFLPGFNAQLVGLALGDTRDLTIVFPEDFREKVLAGRKATYRVTLKGLRQKRVPAITPEFLKPFGVDSEAALREKLHGNLLSTAQDREQGRLHDELARQLLEQTEGDLPQAVLARETQNILRNMIQRLTAAGMTRQQLEGRQKELIAEASRTAADRVKLTYVLRRIADEEKIEADDAEVSDRIQALAAQARVTPAEMRSRIQKQGELEDVRTDVRVQKTLDHVLRLATGKA